ncbi:hypothetical protein HGRIS_003729 [Hohenbuehelia grisea]|uniref:Uncharacterized protein n=1 Tax=Hohenbuehelia grisea TaxID=104357 RepID=A0ABR3JG73_9AGAR
MSHNAKAKAAGISASSFFDLKAELAKKEDEFSKNKAAGKSRAIVGGVKRPDKKPTVWARQNKGVSSRAARDIELEQVSKVTLESARSALERKAKIYEKLQKGKSGGLTDKQYDGLLVDFDSKPVSEFYEPDSDDEDESLHVPRPSGYEEDDPVIEYEDEFGRIRTGRRSEVPRHLLPKEHGGEEHIDDDEDVIYNPVNHFPVYEPSAERVADIAKAHAEENNPLNIHYDSGREVRAKGAGFYQFSADEETRRAQMDELKATREETEKTRQEVGAVDVLPGEVEGMREEGSERSRAMAKRKRELEERRRQIDEKRRKLQGSAPGLPAEAPVEAPSTFSVTVPVAFSQPADPFAALEAESASKGKSRAPVSANPADAFLAQLEQDIFKKKLS